MALSTTIVRHPRRAALSLALAAAVGVVLVGWRLQAGGPAHAAPAAVTATRADLTVSVRGVGRIVQARGSAPIVLPSGPGTNASVPGTPASSQAGGSGGGTTAPADAVFAHATGRVSQLLVAPGERVAAASPLAVLDDGGAAAAAVRQARIELRIAGLELLQKRTNDPLKGLPPTPPELTAGHSAVTSARARLARLLGQPLPADVSASQSDLNRARADLETLRGGPPAARARAIGLAQRDIQLAKQRLANVLAPPASANVSAATLELRKAEVELAALLSPQPPPSPEALAAAQQAVDSARVKLDMLLGTSGTGAAEISAARAELAKAIAELAALTRPASPAAPEAVAAAQQAVDGARLKLTQVLAPASAADVTAARLELERAHAELKKLEAGPSAASSAAASQAVDAARAKLAQVVGPPLRPDVTAARLEVRKAEADLAVLQARGGPGSPTDVSLGRLKVAAARGKLDVARFAARELTVRAPLEGTVTSVLTAPGAPVDPTVPIATVADLDHLAVSVDLSEFDAAQVRQGLPAAVSVDALGGESFRGKVLSVALAGVDNGGLVTFPVRLSLPQVEGVKPGMNASVRIIVAQRRNVVRVPLEAVSEDESGRATVTVLDEGGRQSTRRVRLGLATNKDVEIARGLKAGERVLGTQGE